MAWSESFGDVQAIADRHFELGQGWNARLHVHGESAQRGVAANAEVVCSGFGGADPMVRAGPPGPASRAQNQASTDHDKADGGVGRGPGGPPHNQSK